MDSLMIEGYISVNDIYTIYLSEKFPDSSIPINDNRLSIACYSIMVTPKKVEYVYTIERACP